MITFPKVKAAIWAGSKRLQGYHLLKNPKGTPQTEVNVIRKNYGFSERLDKDFIINRIKKTFSKNGTSEINKSFAATHYFNTENMQMTKPRKKTILYRVFKNEELTDYKFRTDIQYNEKDKKYIKEVRQTPGTANMIK